MHHKDKFDKNIDFIIHVQEVMEEIEKAYWKEINQPNMPTKHDLINEYEWLSQDLSRNLNTDMFKDTCLNVITNAMRLLINEPPKPTNENY